MVRSGRSKKLGRSCSSASQDVAGTMADVAPARCEKLHQAALRLPARYAFRARLCFVTRKGGAPNRVRRPVGCPLARNRGAARAPNNVRQWQDRPSRFVLWTTAVLMEQKHDGHPALRARSRSKIREQRVYDPRTQLDTASLFADGSSGLSLSRPRRSASSVIVSTIASMVGSSRPSVGRDPRGSTGAATVSGSSISTCF